MFAVPGWAVSAQSPVPTAFNELGSSNPGAENSVSTSRSNPRKRKRDGLGPLPQPQITSEDLHKLWSKEFGVQTNGKQSSAKSNKKKKKKKKKEQTSLNSDHEAHAVCEVHTEDGNSAPKGNSSGLREVAQKGTGQRPEKKRQKKPMEVVEKHETDNRAKFASLLEDNKEEDPLVILQNKNVQQKSEKLENLPPASTRLTPLQAKMRDKLTSARFRHLNELLYNSPSSKSLDLFSASPDLFAEYHAGFAQQVKDSWPENPVDGYVRDIKTRGQVGFQLAKQDSTSGFLPLPRRKTGSCTIADLGCGDAPLARALQSRSAALKLRFYSFDLHEPNSLVTKADIANLPLRNGEADVAVFCLSLMGTNWLSFIEEAWRVLRGDGKGELWVAEVKSRFGPIRRKAAKKSAVAKGKPWKQSAKLDSAIPTDDDVELSAEDESTTAPNDTDISAFVTVVQRRGFALRPESVNKRNKMFVSMIFNKDGVPSAGKHQGSRWNGREYVKTERSTRSQKKFIDNDQDSSNLSPGEETKVLKPCVYKKR